jgi:hypothetical protein
MAAIAMLGFVRLLDAAERSETKKALPVFRIKGRLIVRA